MKKLVISVGLSIVVTLLAVVLGVGTESAYAFSGYGAGNGTQPYLISNCEELQEMNDELDANYALANNIDCSSTTTWNSGAGFEPIGNSLMESFSGQFDGNSFVISNLFIDLPSLNNVGLFGYVSSGNIEDVGLVNPDITGQASVGGIIGVIADGEVRYAYVRGGGVTGTIGATGGLVGSVAGGLVHDVYSTAAVDTSIDAGGLVGASFDDLVSDSFWDTQTSGQGTSAGGGTGRTTIQMKTAATYTDGGWDLEQNWDIDSGVNDGYPFLRSYISDADYNGDGLPDELQYGISSYVNPITGKRIVIDVGEACEITTDDYVEESGLATRDADYEYLNGLFDFAGDCGTPGFTTTITLMYYDVEPGGATLRKYNENTGEYSEITSADIEARTINGSTVTVASYALTDGGEFDMDGVEDGAFIDPVGLANFIGSNNSGTGSTNSSSTAGGTLAETGISQHLLTGVAIMLLVMGSVVTVRQVAYRP